IQGQLNTEQQTKQKLEQQLNNETVQFKQKIENIQGQLNTEQQTKQKLEQQLNKKIQETNKKIINFEQQKETIQEQLTIEQQTRQQMTDEKQTAVEKIVQLEEKIKNIQKQLETEQEENKQQLEKEQQSKQKLVQQITDEKQAAAEKIVQLEETIKNIQEQLEKEQQSKQELVQQISDEKQRKEQELETSRQLAEVSIPKAVEEISTITGIAPLMPRIMSANSNILFNRMPVIFKSIGAGDEEESFSNISKGLWIRGLYSISKQNMSPNITGYKSNSRGIVIGFDVGTKKEVGDLFGIAYSHICSDFKFQNQNNKILLSGHIISIYGQKNLGYNLSLQGVLSTTRNYVTNKSMRSIDDKTYNISGKYWNNSYHFDTRLNYNIGLSKGFTMIPGIGIRYEQYQDSAYTETNKETYNLSMAAKSQNFWIGSIGSKLLLPALPITQNVTIIPIIHGFIEKYFNNKNQKIDSKILINNIIFEQQTMIPKQSTVSYNIGTSLLLAKKNTEILMEYNCHLSKRYQSHQGSIRLKIMF
ncbi:autotransporter outer membrane beta-barrel domain-containing protein, partial [Rickettsia endosymbiont of Culicoides newsteadi]|uniref:autotransporter outer membrane beta-barrel domain-containing protein n=1 Tax=Rickettsia endosymbiont of Culicoides newsteadi TaxID=1961830 RepID=UPI0010548510